MALAALAAGICTHAWPFLVDDAFISLRYAERLVAGAGLTWTDGDAVEGYSNLLWVLATAGLMALGCDGIAAVRGLGILATAAALFVLLDRRLTPAGAGRFAVIVLAAQASIAVWAIGGLESPLAMLVVAAVMSTLARVADGSTRGTLAAGILLALLCGIRADGFLWCGPAALALLVMPPREASSPSLAPHAQSRTRWVPLLLPALVAVLLQLSFRLIYYADWLPNTVRAKATIGGEGLPFAVAYLGSAAAALRSLLLPAAIGLLFGWRTRAAMPLLCFAGAAVVGWVGFLLKVGGDTFPCNRLLVPLLAPLTVLAAHGFAAVAVVPAVGRVLAALLAALCLGLATFDALWAERDRHQERTDWELRAVTAGRWLGRAFAQSQPLLAVDAAGAVPYASRLPCLDMLGLCDRTLATRRAPPEFGFIPGHNRGDGDYVLARRPDLVMFWVPPGNPQPRWFSGAALEADARFLRDYPLVLFETGEGAVVGDPARDLRLTLRLHLHGRAGVACTERRMVVPGYLLGAYCQPRPLRLFTQPVPPSDPGHAAWNQEVQAGAQWWLRAAVAGVLAGERLVGRVRAAGRHVTPPLPVAAGRWRIATPSPAPAVDLTLVDASGCALPQDGGAFVVGDRQMVMVACDVAAAVRLPIDVAEIAIERVDS